MKRYEPAETVAGDWVRYEDALAAVAAERERIFGHIRGAMEHAEAGFDDVAWRLLASLVGPNV